MTTRAIDAHAHVFRRGLPLAADRRYAPGYDAPLDAYLALLDAHGLSHGVLVQPSFLGTNNAHLVDCLGQAGGRLRGVAVVEPNVTAVALRDLDAAGVVGIRLNLLGRPLPDLGAPAWTRLVAAVRALDWHVEVQHEAAGLAQVVPRLLDAGCTVVVDHFGLPGAGGSGIGPLLRLAPCGTLWVKLSAPYRSTGGEATARAAYTLLRDAFGPDRLMWGSDWPHTQHEGAQDFARSRRFLDDLTGDAAKAVLAAPRHLFRLPAETRGV